MKRSLQFALSLLFGGFVLFAVLRQFHLAEAVAAVRNARPELFFLGFCLMVLAYLLRGARWRIWEDSLSYSDSLSLILIGFMGNNVLPARLGEVLRAHCAAARLNAARGRTAALASIAAERVLDGLVLALFGLCGMARVSVDPRLQWSLLLVSLVFAVLALALIASIRSHETIRSLIAAMNRKFPGHVTRIARAKAGHFLDGLLPLGSMPRMASAVAATAVIWAIELGFYYSVGLAVWNGMSLRLAVLFLVAVNFGSLIPFTIGGIGTIEVVALSFLVSSGIPRYPALAMILTQHAAQYLFTTVAGGFVYLRSFVNISILHPKGALRSAAVDSAPLSVIEETRSTLGQLREQIELKPAPRSDVYLSIVIPAYNEQARLPRTVLETIHWCTTRKLNFELIIADDGSRDETLALARLFEESDGRVRALSCPHLGKGSAVRMGVLNAKGRFVLFMDADGATPLNEIPKLLKALGEGNDVAIGSRVVQLPGEVDVKTPFYRRIIGRVFAFFVNLFAIEGIGDTQCGFKMFHRDAALAIFSRQRMSGFAFDVEILFIARRLSLTIAEIPVNWTAQTGSKVNIVTDSVKMLKDISLIRWLHRGFQASRQVLPRPRLEQSLESES